jgi:hypothetical protein
MSSIDKERIGSAGRNANLSCWDVSLMTNT